MVCLVRSESADDKEFRAMLFDDMECLVLVFWLRCLEQGRST